MSVTLCFSYIPSPNIFLLNYMHDYVGQGCLPFLLPSIYLHIERDPVIIYLFKSKNICIAATNVYQLSKVFFCYRFSFSIVNTCNHIQTLINDFIHFVFTHLRNEKEPFGVILFKSSIYHYTGRITCILLFRS